MKVLASPVNQTYLKHKTMCFMSRFYNATYHNISHKRHFPIQELKNLQPFSSCNSISVFLFLCWTIFSFFLLLLALIFMLMF